MKAGLRTAWIVARQPRKVDSASSLSLPCPAMSPDPSAESTETATEKKTFLPKIGSWKYHLLLGSVAIFILGPLGGITASYMNFSLGFFVGGQVLAGILGSVITYGYGAEGKHGANFMQTMAASVASMAAMGVLIQAMVWLGLPIPPAWQLVIYFLCVGMFGVGVGMLFTPILVDRLQLTYPSGLAVANILRALTDKRLLKRSVGQLGAGAGIGLGLGIFVEKGEAIYSKIPFLAKYLPKLSASSFGAGMVVGSRIGIPAITIGLIGEAITPWLRTHGYLGAEEPFRKVTFLVALGSIMGAAIIDLSLIFYSVVQRVREYMGKPKGESTGKAGGAPEEDWKKLNTNRLVVWTVIWGAGVITAAIVIMKLPIGFVLFAVGLTFLFIIINGISTGVSDSNPISSAFVVTVLLMAVLGLKDAGVGLMAGAILLVAVSVGVDMQQDRSTGWRLGSNRSTQFRYQVIGITMGAVMAVAMSKLFMAAYPSLQNNSFDHAALKDPHWQSAMTYKFVGALRGLTHPDQKKTNLLFLGLGIGFGLELVRKLVKTNAGYKKWVASSKEAFVFDWFFDAILVPSPYAASFGGFVELATSVNFGAGGIVSSVVQTIQEQTAKSKPKEAKEDLPEDMSSTSLLGGGFIAGDSLAALVIGIISLLGALSLKSAKVEPKLEDGKVTIGPEAEGPHVTGTFTLALKGTPSSKFKIKSLSLQTTDESTLADKVPTQIGSAEKSDDAPKTVELSADGAASVKVFIDSDWAEKKEGGPPPPKRVDLCKGKVVLWAAIEDAATNRPVPVESEPLTPDCGS